MSIDRKSIAAIVVCFLAYLGWEQYLNHKYPNRHKRPTPVATSLSPDQAAREGDPSQPSSSSLATPAPGSGATPASPAAAPITQLSPEELTLDTATSRYVFSQRNGGFNALVLKNYQNDERTAPMNIVPEQLSLRAAPNEAALNEAPPLAYHARREENRVVFSNSQGPWLMEHSITPSSDTYGADIKVSWTNQSGQALELNPTLVVSEKILYQKKSSSFLPGAPTGRPVVIAAIGDSIERRDIQEYCDDGKAEQEPLGGDLQELTYLGFDKHYFLKAFLPLSKKMSYRTRVVGREPGVSCTLALVTTLPQGQVAAGETVSLQYRAWLGPKDSELMSTYHIKLEETLDLGFFSKISHPLLSALKMVNGWVGNWGLAIIILTLVLKMLFYPLTRQTAVAQKRMKKLQPEMERIKEKYKDDPRTQQQEIMRFMSVNKVNPAKGCLPILAQIPVFFAFYRVLSSSIELRHAPFIGWITDLSAADPYYITPLVFGAFTMVQQKLTPMAGIDKTQERIMMMLPLFFTVMMLTLPAGLVLYMLTNTVVSIAQQQWLNKRLA